MLSLFHALIAPFALVLLALVLRRLRVGK